MAPDALQQQMLLCQESPAFPEIFSDLKVLDIRSRGGLSGWAPEENWWDQPSSEDEDEDVDGVVTMEPPRKRLRQELGANPRNAT